MHDAMKPPKTLISLFPRDHDFERSPTKMKDESWNSQIITKGKNELFPSKFHLHPPSRTHHGVHVKLDACEV